MSTNEEIALKLGWKRLGKGTWQNPNGSIWNGVPDFEHDWAHAGPLLEELVRELGWRDMCDRVCHQFLQVPDRELTEDISRAWLAWKKEGKDEQEVN